MKARDVVEVVLAMLFFEIALAICVASFPATVYFPNHAFGDQGWAIRVDGLVADGLVPTVDFSYAYGLLTLAINRAAFWLFGPSPFVVGGMLHLCALLTALGVWRIGRAARLNPWATLVLVATVPLFTIPSNLPSLTHAIEPVLLTHALAEHLRGRRSRALVLATAAVLVKPALGYVYGFLLVVEVLVTPSPDGRSRVRQFLPAAVVGAVLAGGLIADYGWKPFVNTQYPTEASKEYKALNCGFFFGIGTEFWWPTPPPEVPEARHAAFRLRHYIDSPTGPWMVGAVVLLLGAVAAALRWRSDQTARVVVAVAVCLGVFVAFLFSNPHSWIYYPYLPAVGGALVIHQLPAWVGRWGGWPLAVAVGGLLVFLGVTSFLPNLPHYVGQWAGFERSPVTAGLYADPAAVRNWAIIRKLAETEKVFVLCRMGCVPFLAPGIESPKSWYLSEVIGTEAELDYVRERIAACDWLVVPSHHDQLMEHWAAFREQTAAFRLDRPDTAVTYKLFKRVTPRSPPP